MNTLLILLMLAVFMLPSLLLMRKQKARQAELAEFQAGIAPGDRVITVAGVHGTVAAVGEGPTVQLEVAPGVTLTVERAGISRRVVVAD